MVMPKIALYLNLIVSHRIYVCLLLKIHQPIFFIVSRNPVVFASSNQHFGLSMFFFTNSNFLFLLKLTN